MASGPPSGNFSQGPAISNGPPIGGLGPGNVGVSNPYRSSIGKGRKNMYQATNYFRDVPTSSAGQHQNENHGRTGVPSSQQADIPAGFNSYPTQWHTEVGAEFRPIIPDSAKVNQRTEQVPVGPAFSGSQPALSQHTGSQLSPSPLQRSHQSAFRNVSETAEENLHLFQGSMAHNMAFQTEEMHASGEPWQPWNMSNPVSQQKPKQKQQNEANISGMEQQFSQLSLHSPNSTHTSSSGVQHRQQIGDFTGQSLGVLGQPFQSLPLQTGFVPDRHQQGNKQSHSFHGRTEEKHNTWDASFNAFTSLGHGADAQRHQGLGNELGSPSRENLITNNILSSNNPLHNENALETFQTSQNSGTNFSMMHGQTKVSSSLQYNEVNLSREGPPIYAVGPDARIHDSNQDSSLVPAAFGISADSQEPTLRYGLPNQQQKPTKETIGDVYSHQEGSEDSTTDEESDLDTEDQTSSNGDITDDEYSGVDNPEGGSQMHTAGYGYRSEDSSVIGPAMLKNSYTGEHGNVKAGMYEPDKMHKTLNQDPHACMEYGHTGQRDFADNVGCDNSDNMHQRKGTTQRSPKDSPRSSKHGMREGTMWRQGGSPGLRKQKRESPVSVELFSGHGLSNHQEFGVTGKPVFSRRENSPTEKQAPPQARSNGPPKVSDSSDDVTKLFGRNPSSTDWFAKAQLAASSSSVKQDSNMVLGAMDTQKEVVQGRMVNPFTTFDQEYPGVDLHGQPLPVLAQASEHYAQPHTAISRVENRQQQHSGLSDENLSNGWVNVLPKAEPVETKKMAVFGAPPPVRQALTETPPTIPATKKVSGTTNASDMNTRVRSGDSVAGNWAGPEHHTGEPFSQETRQVDSQAAAAGFKPSLHISSGLDSGCDLGQEDPTSEASKIKQAFAAFKFVSESEFEFGATVGSKKSSDTTLCEVPRPCYKEDCPDSSAPANREYSHNRKEATSFLVAPHGSNELSRAPSWTGTIQQEKVESQFGNAGQQLSPDLRNNPTNQTEEGNVVEPVQHLRQSSGQGLNDHLGQLYSHEEMHLDNDSVSPDMSLHSNHPSGATLHNAAASASFSSLHSGDVSSCPSQAESAVQPEFAAESWSVQRGMPSKGSGSSLPDRSVHMDLKTTSSQAPVILGLGNPVVPGRQTVPAPSSQTQITEVKQIKGRVQTADDDAPLQSTDCDSRADRQAADTEAKAQLSRSHLPGAVFVPKLPAARSSTAFKAVLPASQGHHLESGLTSTQKETLLKRASIEKLHQSEQTDTVCTGVGVKDGGAFFDQRVPSDDMTTMPPPVSLSAHPLPSSDMLNYMALPKNEATPAPSKVLLGSSSSVHSGGGFLPASESVISTRNNEITPSSATVLATQEPPIGQAAPPRASVPKSPSRHFITESLVAHPFYDGPGLASTSLNTLPISDIGQNPQPTNIGSALPAHNAAKISSPPHLENAHFECSGSLHVEPVSNRLSGQNIAIEGAPKHSEGGRFSDTHPPDVTTPSTSSDGFAQASSGKEMNHVEYGIPPAAVPFSAQVTPNPVPVMQSTPREGQHQLQPQPHSQHQPQPQLQYQPQHQPQPQPQHQPQPQPQVQPQPQHQPQLQPQPRPQLQPQPQHQPQLQPQPQLPYQPQHQPQPQLQPQLQPQPQHQPQPTVLEQQQNTLTSSRPGDETVGLLSGSVTGQPHLGAPGEYQVTQETGSSVGIGQQSYGSLPQDPGSFQGAAPSGPSSMPSAMYDPGSQGYGQPSSMDHMAHASQMGQQPIGMSPYGAQYPNPYAAGYGGMPSQMYNNYWMGGMPGNAMMPGYYDWYYSQWANYYHNYNNYLAQQWENMSEHSANFSYQSSQQPSEVDVDSRPTSALAAAPQHQASYMEEDPYKPSLLKTETPPPMERLTPLHFNRPHVVARCDRPGVTVITDPSQPEDGIPAVVHRVPSGQLLPPVDISEFPGPLVVGETSKKTVVAFARRKAAEYLKLEKQEGRAKALLWEYCALLVQRNGLLDGADVADLLLQKAFTTPFSQKEEMKYPGKQEVDSFRGLMLQGAKRDAINYAIREGLWGHAFTLAFMGDPRSVKLLIAKFLSTVDPEDPLSTLYNHLGNKGAGSYPYIVKGAGDWIQHLCMILSNPSPEKETDVKGILSLGDALLQDGQISGAHLCYLVAGLQPRSHKEEDTKISLISQDHREQTSRSDLWADNDSIQLTEIFEFAVRLQSRDSFIVAFQHFKCMYAMRLIGCGLIAEGFAYLQVVAEAILLQPSSYTADLIASVVRMARNVSLLQASTPEDIPDWINDLQRIMDGTERQEIASSRSVSNQSSYDHLPSKSKPTTVQYESQSSSASSDQLETESNTSLGHFAPTETPISASYREWDYHQSNETGSLYDSASQHGLEPPLEGCRTGNAGPAQQAYAQFDRTGYTIPSVPKEPEPQYGYSDNQAHNEQGMPQVPMFGTDYGQAPSIYDPESLDMVSGELAAAGSENPYGEEEEEEEDLFDAFKKKNKRKTVDQIADGETKESASASSSKDGKEDSAKSATPKKGWLSGVFSKVFGGNSKEIHLPDSKMTLYFDKEKNKWIDPDEEEETKNLPPPPPTIPYKGPNPSASGPAGPLSNSATPATGPTTLLSQASTVMPPNSAGTNINPTGLPGASRLPEPVLRASQVPAPAPGTSQASFPMSGPTVTDTPSGSGEEPPGPAAPPSIFSRKAHGFGRRGPRYVNTMGNAKSVSNSTPLPGLFDPMAMNAATPTNFFVPSQPAPSADAT